MNTKEVLNRIPKKTITISVPLIAMIIIVVTLFAGIAKAVSSINMSVFFAIAGEELEADLQGQTNFLLLGTGGEKHDGGNLTDSIIVASLDIDKQIVTMLSIPRDYYIKDDIVGNSKINEVYYYAKKHYDDNSEKGVEHLKTKIEQLMGIDIHYWIKIDFKGFTEMIDAIGGIDVDVKEDIFDPYYPKDGTYEYEPFSIQKGYQHLNGETALKYARSRKTTSDFDRADRQQQILYAVKDQALKTNVIFSRQKVENILQVLKNNLETNITIKEILTLGSLTEKLTPDSIIHKLLHDNDLDCGGFLYTPERKYYNDQYVLLPAGGQKFVHWYADLIFNHPQLSVESPTLHLLNGTKVVGVAGETKQILQRYCFDVVRFGNARNQEIKQTTYYYRQNFNEKGDPVESRPNEALDFLQKLIPGKESTDIPEEYSDYKADIIIEMGTDYAESPNYISDPFTYLYSIVSSDEDENSESETPATQTGEVSTE